jgi:carbonic anhydrase
MSMNSSRYQLIVAAAVLAVLAVAAGTAGADQPASAATQTQAAPHWDYGTEAGPANWSKLSLQYAACGEGKSQSPIDIVTPGAGQLGKMRNSYKPAALQIVHRTHTAEYLNNGHTIQVNYSQADSLVVDDMSFVLLQYHFHSPSEHTVQGRHAPMEMHLVHKSADGKLAVVAVFIEEGKANRGFDPIWKNLPTRKDVVQRLDSVKVDVNQLLPKETTSYRYDGSLTTPPCSEGVRWFVMTQPIQMSKEQIEAFQAIIHDNNRPVQPLNGRTVLTDATKEVKAK